MNNTAAEIRDLIIKGQLAKAHSLYVAEPDAIDSLEYKGLRAERIEKRKETISREFAKWEFDEARAYADLLRQVLLEWERTEFDNWWNLEEESAAHMFMQKQVLPLLERDSYREARELYVQKFPDPSDLPRYELVEGQRRRVQQDWNLLGKALGVDNFAHADEIFLDTEYISEEEYLERKSVAVERFVKRRMGLSIDRDKARAMSSIAQNTLVAARAGSGKTTLLGCLVRILVETCGVSEDRILVMAFNRSAAIKIRNEIQKVRSVAGFKNARTFHSLAYWLTPPERRWNVLFDPPSDGPSEAYEWERSRAGQIRVAWDKLYSRKSLLWAFTMYIFREELTQSHESLDPRSTEYLLYRRNESQATLRGEQVKSVGEKWIADFLLEHDISYGYESVHRWDGELYRPDFTIGRHKLVIEHWALDPEDLCAKLPEYWDVSTEEYRTQILSKRKYWSSRPDWRFIETNSAQVGSGRETFEMSLREQLTGAGIPCIRLPLDEIKRRIKSRKTTRFIELVGQLISRAKKKGLDPEGVRDLYKTAKTKKVRAFGRVGWRVYASYERESRLNSNTDYDSLLLDALKTLRKHDTQNDMIVRISGKEFSLSNLSWILIDEYQDFSQAFYNLIAALRDLNPRLRLFCVGDDWQAINEFAGSDLKFFNEFESLISPARRFPMHENRRSRTRIVAAGNRLMRGRQDGAAHALKTRRGGQIEVMYVDDVPFSNFKDMSGDASANDEQFSVRRRSGSPDFVASRYLKLLSRILNEAETSHCSILTRTRYVGALDLPKLRSRLIDYASQERREGLKKQLYVGTIHGFKGKERDLTVVLQVTHRRFPLVHPDGLLFEPLGYSIGKVLAEERRLFYVAISRARDRLILITEKGRESSYIADALGADWRQKYLVRFPSD